MSMVLNMTGGGGRLKNTDAVLLVTVPTGSSVTATRGAITLTPTIWTTYADNTLDVAVFIIKASQFSSYAWTVTATLGTESASGTITINSAKEFTMELSYTLYLYRAGDTGGWTNLPWKASSSWAATAASVGYNPDSMVISQTNSHSSVTYHTASVDLTDYSTLVCDVSSWPSTADTYNGLYVFLSVSSTSTVYPSAATIYKDKTGSGSQTITIDVSALTGGYYVGIATARTSNVNTIAGITGVYLR